MKMFEDVPPLSIFPFFTAFSECKHLSKDRKTFFTKEYKLPSASSLLNEEDFADVYLAWQEDKFLLHLELRASVQGVFFPNFRKGDSIELFFDTRDLKTRKFISQFCHHFVFFPEKIEGHFGKEVTRFRTDDIHPLADPEDLKADVQIKQSSYMMDISIPSFCLVGYDPENFPRIGFALRINALGVYSQHFPITSEEYVVEQNPHLWSTLNLLI